jgi:hypothetical protein
MGIALFDKIVDYPALARYSFGACEFNNRIYISGGVNGSTYLSDVWSSVDGIHWDCMASGANSFSAREGHVMLAHDSKLYVLGGYNGTVYLGDVWMSNDGTKWDRVFNTSAVDWIRESACAWSLNGKIVVAGGDSSAVAGTYFSDVLSSPDGSTWTRLINNYSRVRRSNAAYCLFNNRAHMICGYDGTNSVDYDTAVTSVDGTNWDITGSTCGLPLLTNPSACSFDNKIVVTGGYSSARQTTHGSGLYYSTDGEKYHYGGNMGFSSYYHKMVALKEPSRMFLLFGYTGTAARSDIWMSTGNWQANNP